MEHSPVDSVLRIACSNVENCVFTAAESVHHPRQRSVRVDRGPFVQDRADCFRRV